MAEEQPPLVKTLSNPSLITVSKADIISTVISKAEIKRGIYCFQQDFIVSSNV